MPFKIELTSKKDRAGGVSYEVEVTQDATFTASSTPTFHSFATLDAAEQFKKAQVALFRSKEVIVPHHHPKKREDPVAVTGKEMMSI